MKKYFNIAGPCNKTDHYMIPILDKCKNILNLIDNKQYFVIHAARQSGKTTTIKFLTNYLNNKNECYALYFSLESVQVFGDAKDGIPEIFKNIRLAIKHSMLPFKEKFGINLNLSDYSTLIKEALIDYCMLLDKPLVLFIDEIDCLKNDTLLSFLRQLRDGYISRDDIPFPKSIALVGMRNIKDYKIEIRKDIETLGSVSPFNIISESLNIKNFTFEDLEILYSQHTSETNQIFDKEVIQRIYDKTNGQPWLVNAIAREIVQKILDNDFSKPITIELVEQAIQNIIIRRDTHIDSLLYKLKDTRVQKIIEPIILGKTNEINITDDDTQFCIDLGLIVATNGDFIPANKIYNEVIIRTLNYDSQYNLQNMIKNVWIDQNGKIDMNGLLKGFQQFWRENSNIWVEKYQFKEAAPHLILQAFLQRIINGGGSILREYAAGRERMDICVVYENYKYPIELKIKYSNAVINVGIEQLSNYLETLGESTGWLILFDRNPKTSWDEKISWETKTFENKIIHILGC